MSQRSKQKCDILGCKNEAPVTWSRGGKRLFICSEHNKGVEAYKCWSELESKYSKNQIHKVLKQKTIKRLKKVEK